ncbi:glycosyltransferase family 2 protein [Bacillus sp. PAMC26568]|nr:glycosyltransferase family 2 protein [Bacillus sp. PAMC26568]
MKITVFTPTYNRAYTLENLYLSLKAQTWKDFEWLVIDDGSTDNTEELFHSWIKKENGFSIRYFKVKNGGKHRAINKATDLARGDLFFIVDSDDTITHDAIGMITSWEKSLKRKPDFCGISGNKGHDEKSIHGTTFEGDYIDATSLERKKFNITGDKAEVFYTEILKRYKFKEFDGENFLTEATVWDRMAADGYKIRWFNKTIYICDYLEDGLTNNLINIFAENPKGTAHYINHQIKCYQYNLKGRLSNYNLYYSFVKNNVGLRTAARYLEINPVVLLLAVVSTKLKQTLIK